MNENIKKYKIGCVHGRFQPIHLGHLEYILEAYKFCEFLYIGIANSDPSHIQIDEASPHRHLKASNPFPYFARMEMILGALIDENISLSNVRFIPFPINRFELLKYYVPSDVVHLMTIYDKWGERKLQQFKNHNLKIEVLEMRKVTTSTKIRELLLKKENISHLVPKFVNNYLEHNATKYL